MIRKFLNLLNQKAQALAMYALLVPLLFSTGGAAVELGWYYMNVSRLQNMADSAIIASAQVLTKKDNEFSNYRYNYYLPEVPEKLKPDPDRKSLSGDLEAKKYISKNLEISSDWKDKDSVTDTFSNVELNFSKKIYPTKDAEDYPILYYEITLTETPNHFFDFFNSFGDIKITATAVAKFTQIPDTTDERHGPTFYEQMESLKADKVYDYWEVIQNEYKEEANELKAEMELEIATTGLDREIVKASYIEKLVAKYSYSFICFCTVFLLCYNIPQTIIITEPFIKLSLISIIVIIKPLIPVLFKDHRCHIDGKLIWCIILPLHTQKNICVLFHAFI